MIIFVAILLGPPLAFGASQPGSAEGASESIQVNVAPLQYVRVTFAAGTNVSVLSVTGGAYSLTLSNVNHTNAVQIVPMDQSAYEVTLSSVATGASFASVSVQGSPQDTQVSNFSSYGNITVHLSIDATHTGERAVVSPQTGSAGTFISFTQIELEVIGSLAVAAGVYLLVLTFRYRPELSLIGLALVVLGGMEIVGALLALLALAAYLTGYVALGLGWKIHLRRRG